MKKYIMGAGLLLVSMASNSMEWTAFNTVGSMQQTVNNQQTFIQPEGNKWGPAGCPNAVFVVVNNSMPAYREILASVLTAKASETELRVFGECTNATYFAATQFQFR